MLETGEWVCRFDSCILVVMSQYPNLIDLFPMAKIIVHGENNITYIRDLITYKDQLESIERIQDVININHDINILDILGIDG